LLAANHPFLPEDGIKLLHICDKGKKLDLLETLEISKALKSPDVNCINEQQPFNTHFIFNNISD